VPESCGSPSTTQNTVTVKIASVKKITQLWKIYWVGPNFLHDLIRLSLVQIKNRDTSLPLLKTWAGIHQLDCCCKMLVRVYCVFLISFYHCRSNYSYGNFGCFAVKITELYAANTGIVMLFCAEHSSSRKCRI
jgi:hypothetical protein